VALGIALHRESHGGNREGRYRTRATLLDLDPEIIALAPMARKKFASEGHYPNSTLGMWRDLELRARLENAIERAALGMSGIFKASDVRAIVGSGINPSSVLKRLVLEGRLILVSAKKYMVAPPQIVERADWVH
jgi:hypothetical protein